MLKLISSIAVLSLLFSFWPGSALAIQAFVQDGDLMKLTSSSAVYVIRGSERYVYPHSSVYKSWHNDTAMIHVVDEVTMTSFWLAGRVPMAAGQLIKIQSDPRVYETLDSNGSIRWVQSEQEASDRFGLAWAQRVVDVSPAFWTDYRVVSEPPATNIIPSSSLVELNFVEIFSGYGSVNVDADAGTVALRPMVSTSSNETHAGLVRTDTTLSGDYEIRATLKTNEQLREGSPANPWEVAWLLFGYNADGTFKYLILKPDGYGLELGESLGNDIQNFLWTSPLGTQSYEIESSYAVALRVVQGVVTILVNEQEVLSYVQGDSDLLDANGYVGFYSEDADVLFSDIELEAL